MNFVDVIFINCIVISILCALKEPLLRLIVCLCVDIDTNDDIDTTDNRDTTEPSKNAKVFPLYDDVHIVIINPSGFQIGTVAKVLPE